MGDQQHFVVGGFLAPVSMRHGWEIAKSLNRLADATEKLVEARRNIALAVRLVASPNPLLRAYGSIELVISIGEVTAAGAMIATEAAFLVHNADKLDEASLKTQETVRDVIDKIDSPIDTIVDFIDEKLGLDLKSDKDLVAAVEGLKSARNALRNAITNPKSVLDWIKRLNLVRNVATTTAELWETFGDAVKRATANDKSKAEREPNVREPWQRYVNPDGTPRKPARGPYPEPY